MKHRPHQDTATTRGPAPRATLTLLAAALALLAFTSSAQAKEAIDFFGGPGTLGGQFAGFRAGVAVNDTGAGPGDTGDIYALDPNNHRIQRFGRDDGGTPGGTPADTADDTYFFISAWGADVVQSGGTGDQGDAADANYEICTVASECKEGVESGGNGTAAGNGSLGELTETSGVAVDPDTGDVFVTDSGNARVNVYDGVGNFLRSFGFDVIETGTNDNGTGYEVCVQGDDICQAGDPGSGTGQLGESTAGIAVSPGAADMVFLADTANRRVNTYGLDGTSPGSIGSGATFGSSAPRAIAVDSRGILYANNISPNGGGVERYDTENANGEGVGFLPPLRPNADERQRLHRNATAGQFRLTFEGETTGDIPYNASSSTVDAALEALPAIGAGNTSVGDCFCPEGHYDITFLGSLTNTDVGELTVSNGTVPLTGTISVTTLDDGFGDGSVNERQDVTIAATAGTFKLSFDPDGAGPQPPETTADIPYNAPAQSGGVRDALHALPSVNFGDINTGGGPGNASGSSPYRIDFRGAYGGKDVAQLTVSNGSAPLSGGAGASVATVVPGQPGLIPGSIQQTDITTSLAVDPDEDGAGPETDVLYVGRGHVVQQFGPVNEPGLTAPPTDEDERHNTNGVAGFPAGLAVEPSTGRLYAGSNGPAGTGVYVLDEASTTPPTATLDGCDTVTERSLTCQAMIDPNGPPATRYRFEYVTDAEFQANGFDNASSTAEVILGAQETPQSVEEEIDPGLHGLDPATTYHVRVVAGRKFADPVISNELTAATDPVAPLAETTGTPLRTSTTATLLGRVTPRGSATDYRFEYGTTGPCGANPCQTTGAQSAGAGQQQRFVAAGVTGLSANTTYHYRLLADNGTGGEIAGGNRTLTTRATDALPNQNDRSVFPGPPGSDRAWELVSLPDSGGNPLFSTLGFSTDGNRAVYRLLGGNPIASSGSIFAIYTSQRPTGEHPATGWQTTLVTPPRAAVPYAEWYNLAGADDLSSFVSVNGAGDTETGQVNPSFWRLSAGAQPQTLFGLTPPQRLIGFAAGIYIASSSDGSRILGQLSGGVLDPAFPAADSTPNLYDVGTPGEPKLLSLLPGETVPACGIVASSGVDLYNQPSQHSRVVSADGGLVYFSSRGDDCGTEPQLYLRDIDAAQTRLVSGPPVSGPACGAALVKGTSEAAFLWTQTRLEATDTEPAACDSSATDGDVYRYDLVTEALECVTCAAAIDADVSVGGSPEHQLAVAPDGSRVYFSSSSRLLSEAPAGGSSTYRVNVASGDLAFVAPVGGSAIGTTASARAGLTPDGTQLYFRAQSAVLDSIGGPAAAGTAQYYRYDDTERSLVCVSCPPDGSVPLGDVDRYAANTSNPDSPNVTHVADDGTLAFSTPVPLLGADQNTPAGGGDPFGGTDVYEYRDGRLLLVTDGLTQWPGEGQAPQMRAISPSGRDLFFAAPAQYTPDALDGFMRLYTARIGGGIEFPPEELPPCDLNSGACEGAPSGAPELPGAGSAAFHGPGDVDEPFRRSCVSLAQRTRKLAGAARRLRARARRMARLARRSSGPRLKRIANRRARRFARASRRRATAAKRLRVRAKRCRATNRARANPDRRANR